MENIIVGIECMERIVLFIRLHDDVYYMEISHDVNVKSYIIKRIELAWNYNELEKYIIEYSDFLLNYEEIKTIISNMTSKRVEHGHVTCEIQIKIFEWFIEFDMEY